MKVGDPRPNVPTTTVEQPQDVAAVATPVPAKPAAPVDRIATGGPLLAPADVQTPPPAVESAGLATIASLIADDNFGDHPNARPALKLDHGFDFDLSLLSMDLGAWAANELKAHPDNAALRELTGAFPGGLSALSSTELKEHT